MGIATRVTVGRGLTLAGIGAFVWAVGIDKLKSWVLENLLSSFWARLMKADLSAFPWALTVSSLLVIGGLVTLAWPWLEKLWANSRAALLGEAPIVAVHEKMDLVLAKIEALTADLLAQAALVDGLKPTLDLAIWNFSQEIKQIGQDVQPIVENYRKAEALRLADIIETWRILDPAKAKGSGAERSVSITYQVLYRTERSFGPIGYSERVKSARDAAIKKVHGDIKLCKRDGDDDNCFDTDEEKKSWHTLNAELDAIVAVLRNG